MEEKFQDDAFELDTSIEETLTEVPSTAASKPKKKKKVVDTSEDSDTIIESCLRNERICVKHVPKESGMATPPGHIMSGGMHENAVKVFTVPILSSGIYVNVLTDKEKAFLEEVMGLEYNALSIYKKVDNFWDNFQVRLRKQDNYFDLSNPDDYIKYKVLLANKDYIAASMQDLIDHPKATYQFVITSEGEDTKINKSRLNAKMESYKEYGKVEDNIDILRMIVETLDGRPTAPSVKLEFLQNKIDRLIEGNSALFLKTIKDPLLTTKVLLKKAVESGIVVRRGDYYYMRDGMIPLCNNNEEPTLQVAAKFLNLPKNQELKLSIEAKTQ